MEAQATWWRGGVIYQIYPRSFAYSNRDGIGDLADITGWLDHIAKPGVAALWLSPFFKSPMQDFGYDVADCRAVDPIGTPGSGKPNAAATHRQHTCRTMTCAAAGPLIARARPHAGQRAS